METVDFVIFQFDIEIEIEAQQPCQRPLTSLIKPRKRKTGSLIKPIRKHSRSSKRKSTDEKKAQIFFPPVKTESVQGRHLLQANARVWLRDDDVSVTVRIRIVPRERTVAEGTLEAILSWGSPTALSCLNAGVQNSKKEMRPVSISLWVY